jgi:hypothetical protein
VSNDSGTFLRRVAASLIMWLPLALFAQPTRNPPPEAAGNIIHLRQDLSQSVAKASEYLERNCDDTGRFAYLVDTDLGQISPSYNVVRHAGAVYALAMLNDFNYDSTAVNTMVRAANFMRANFLAPDARSSALAIWSRPPPMNTKAELGAAGLGIVAFSAVEHARPNTIRPVDLEALGKFVLFLQKPDGSFYSRYFADKGLDRDWQSLYYPGEAALGLISLYELDHSQKWLAAAGRGLAYLAQSRQGPHEVPPDHWALIATAKFLPYYQQSACPAARAELIQYAIRVCNRFTREQITNAPDPRVNGSFDPTGKTTPTAIRMEGLLAALEFLPKGELRERVEATVQRGIAFLINAQITSGPYAGGMPGAVLTSGSPRNAHSTSEVRIDYVQHALSAWLRYETLHAPSSAHRSQ